MRVLRALLVAAFLAASANPAAALVTFSVDEDVINDYLRATPPVSGSGQRTFSVSSVCMDGWRPRTCRKPVLSGQYAWSLSDVRVSVSPRGISFTGRLRASYDRWSYTTRVSGNGTLRLRNGRLAFDLDEVRVPIRFDLPVVGDVTVATVPVRPTASFEERVGIFSVVTAAGVRLGGSLLSPTLTLHDGRISFSGIAVPRR